MGSIEKSITFRKVKGATVIHVTPEVIIAKKGQEDLDAGGNSTGWKAFKVKIQVSEGGPLLPYGVWEASSLPTEIGNYIISDALSWRSEVSLDKKSFEYTLYLSKDAVVSMSIPFTITCNGIMYNKVIQFITVADGVDGENSDGGSGEGSGVFVKLDLDNENDSIIYNDTQAVNSVKTTGTLYINGEPKPVGEVTWSHSQVGIEGEGTNNIKRTNNVIEVSGMESQAGYVTLKATYNSVTYASVFSLKKVVNSSKYSIIPSVGAIVFNPSEDDNQTINIGIKKTDPEGKVIDVTSLNGLKLTYRYDDNTETNLDSQSFTWKAATDQNYRNIAFTLYDSNDNYQDSENVSLIGINVQESLGSNAAFKSFVFTRSNNEPQPPSPDKKTVNGIEYNTYNNPIPWNTIEITNEDGSTSDKLIWSDGIPDGEEILWCSTRIFSSDGLSPQQDVWGDPKTMTDTADFDVEFSSLEAPGDPSGHPNINGNWSNESNKDTIWMATSTCKNGEWTKWQVSKIKGEKGNDGTSIKVAGHYENIDAFKNAKNDDGTPKFWDSENNEWIAPENLSDCYVVGTDLYVWDGSDEWINVGPFKGDKGDTAYIHTKYANKSDDGTEVTLNDGTTVKLSFTNSNGEDPGLYFGIKANYTSTPPSDISDYTWAKWYGEDGFGYEYIYCRTPGNNAPDIPTKEIYGWTDDTYQENDFVPTDPTGNLVWTDEPVDVDEGNTYCWVCTRQKVGGKWQAFKGAKDTSKAAYWTKWSKDGKDGNSIRLDLDNEYDSIIYDEAGVKKSDSVTTTGRLYDGGEVVNALWNISDQQNVDVELPWTGSNGMTAEYATITVNGLTNKASSGYVTLKATYNGNSYYATFNVKRIINQSKYELKCSKNAIVHNLNEGDHIYSIYIEVYCTDIDGNYGRAETLPSGYAIFYETNGNEFSSSSESKQLEYTEHNGKKCAKYSFDTSNGFTSVRFILSNDTTNWTFLDSEEIPITYVQDGENTGGSGSVEVIDRDVVTIYKASYDEPQPPSSFANIADEGWSTERFFQDTEMSIEHGGLWSNEGEGLYQSFNKIYDNITYTSFEEFFMIHVEEGDPESVSIPFRVSAGAKSQFSIVKRKRPTYNENGVIESITDETNADYNHYKNYNNDALTVKYFNDVFVEDRSSFRCYCVHRINDLFAYSQIQFGNQPVWKCEYKVDSEGNFVDGSLSTTVIKTSDVLYKIKQVNNSNIKDNLFLGSRFLDGRRNNWIIPSDSSIAGFFEGFNGNNKFSYGNKFSRALEYILYDVNNDSNTLQEDQPYILSFRAQGNTWTVCLVHEYTGTCTIDGQTHNVTINNMYLDDVSFDGGAVTTNFSFDVLPLNRNVYSYHYVKFSPYFGYDEFEEQDVTIDGNTYRTTVTGCELQNIRLVFYYEGEEYTTGNYYWGSIQMPKLELTDNSYPTEFCVHYTDIGAKRNAPMRVREWKAGLTWYSGEKDSDLYTDVAIKNGVYYNCLINHTSNDTNSPGTNTTYWNPAEEFSFIATNLLLAERAYIKNLVSEIVRTAFSGPRLVAEGNSVKFYGDKDKPALVLGVDTDGNGVLDYYDQNTGRLLYRLGPNELQSFKDETLVVEESCIEIENYRIVSETDNKDVEDTDWAVYMENIFSGETESSTMYKYTAKRKDGDVVITNLVADKNAAMNADGKILAFRPDSTNTIVGEYGQPSDRSPFSGFVVMTGKTYTEHEYARDTDKRVTINGVEYSIAEDYDDNEYGGIEVDWSISSTSEYTDKYNNPVLSMQIIRFLNGERVNQKTVYKNKY